MEKPIISLYNTLTQKIEPFIPLHPNQVNIYVCGPTVYSPSHFGHARVYTIFDTLRRLLKHIGGYQVKYVSNITDVGHLLNDHDHAEDKISKKAREQKVSPMEVATLYTQSHQHDMSMLNILPPTIQPLATGHIIEQINLIKTLLAKGYAYQVNNAVYFDVNKYHTTHNYGILSRRKIQDLLTGTRKLLHQQDKRQPLDFALWKKATPNRLMHWTSPWGPGFPGWHIECTAMSTQYLGKQFDIHGGGIDLTFPHHECEIAQNQIALGTQPAKYWLHTNLVTIHGSKMSKSAGNFIPLATCFQGTHPLLTKPYSPTVVRFFLLQTHYRKTLNISDQALQAAEKAYYKLLNAHKILQNIHYPTPNNQTPNQKINTQIQQLCTNTYNSLSNDLNTPQTLAHLFNLTKYIHAINQGKIPLTQLTKNNLQHLKTTYNTLFQNILALDTPPQINAKQLIQSLITIYHQAKKNKNYHLVNTIRQALKKQHITLQDQKNNIDWSYNTPT